MQLEDFLKTHINFRNSILYVIGLLFISLGVALSFRHGFGASSADNLTFILSVVLNISIGTANFLISALIITLLIISFKNWKFLFLFVQVIILSPLIDFWDLIVFANLIPVGFERMIVFIASILSLPLGCSFLIKSTYPAGVYDELMFFTAHFTKLKLTVSRILNELLLVLTALTISLLSGNGYGSVNIGTLAYVFSVGHLIKFYLSSWEFISKRRNKNASKSNDRSHLS